MDGFSIIAAGPIVEGNGPDILRSALSPCCGLAVWKRRAQPNFQTWIDSVPAENLPKLRVVLSPERVADAIALACDISGLHPVPERRILVEDVAALAAFFAEVMGVAMVSLRLEPVAGEGCNRFHQDCVTARLLCTYRGAGTHYAVADEMGLIGVEGQIAMASVGVLRGKLWQGGAEAAMRVLHRSPPVQSGEAPRLLLAIDPVMGEMGRKGRRLH